MPSAHPPLRARLAALVDGAPLRLHRIDEQPVWTASLGAVRLDPAVARERLAASADIASSSLTAIDRQLVLVPTSAALHGVLDEDVPADPGLHGMHLDSAHGSSVGDLNAELAEAAYAASRVTVELRLATGEGVTAIPADRATLLGPAERWLLALLADSADVLDGVRRPRGVKRLAVHLHEMSATTTHWLLERPPRPQVWHVEATSEHAARLELAVRVRDILRIGLAALGTSAPDKM